MSLLGFSREFASLKYLRLDAVGMPAGEVLQTVKSFLVGRFPVVLGFAVPRSMAAEPDIPYRPTFESIRGGQAIVAVGYDDNYRSATRGALLVRNSWGSKWGDHGYGWLPYTYVLQRLAHDFWTIVRDDWLNSGEFFDPGMPKEKCVRGNHSDR